MNLTIPLHPTITDRQLRARSLHLRAIPREASMNGKQRAERLYERGVAVARQHAVEGVFVNPFAEGGSAWHGYEAEANRRREVRDRALAHAERMGLGGGEPC